MNEDIFIVLLKASPLFAMIFLLMTTTTVVYDTWVRDLEKRGRRYTQLASLREKTHDYAILIQHFMHIHTIQERIDGREQFNGARPFLVGLWRWIILPFCLFYVIVAAVILMIINSYWQYVVGVTIFLDCNIKLYGYLFDRFEKRFP